MSVDKVDNTVSNDTEVKYKSVEELPEIKGNTTVYICNSLPYINVLEYGGYPDPVKYGSWDKKQHKFVIKSINGYSKQAPQGMVGLTCLEFDRYVKESIKE